MTRDIVTNDDDETLNCPTRCDVSTMRLLVSGLVSQSLVCSLAQLVGRLGFFLGCLLDLSLGRSVARLVIIDLLARSLGCSLDALSQLVTLLLARSAGRSFGQLVTMLNRVGVGG